MTTLKKVLDIIIQWLSKIAFRAPESPVAPNTTLPILNPVTTPNLEPQAPSDPNVYRWNTPEPTAPVAPTKTKAQLLNEFCLAIQSREGYYGPGVLPGYPKGTPAYVNNNPGNITYGIYAKKLGAIRANGRFAVFRDYDSGFSALRQLVLDAAKGKLQSYKPSMTCVGFFEVYAPKKDDNDPISYGQEVQRKLGVDKVWTISNLV